MYRQYAALLISFALMGCSTPPSKPASKVEIAAAGEASDGGVEHPMRAKDISSAAYCLYIGIVSLLFFVSSGKDREFKKSR
jgi:hypothetical protein